MKLARLIVNDCCLISYHALNDVAPLRLVLNVRELLIKAKIGGIVPAEITNNNIDTGC
ncbi:MAG: hypothetical protein ACLQT6_16800 [Desulfomonilaceae bacterium]